MSELLIELFSEEMPPNLQISARAQFKKLLNSKHKFSVICDDSWRKYWSKRFINRGV